MQKKVVSMQLRSLSIALALTGASFLGVGCGTAINVHVLRPAHFTSPHPTDTVEVVDFAIPQPVQPVYSPAFQGYGGRGGASAQLIGPRGESITVQAPGALGIFLAAHQARGEDVQVVAYVEGHAVVASALGNGLREAFASSPSQRQTLVPRGGSLIVSGQVSEATFTETLERRPSECRRSTTDARGRASEVRVPCTHIALRWQTHVSAELIVRDPQGQVLYTYPFQVDDGDVTEGDYEDPNALVGGTADPSIYQGQILATANRVLEAMRRHVVPYWDFFQIEWLDARGLPAEEQALHDQARGHAREEPTVALALLDQLLGGEATPETADNPVAIARVLANRSGLRVATGQYDKALDDMRRANAWLPGCIQAERMNQAQTMVAEQAALRAQGVSPSQ